VTRLPSALRPLFPWLKTGVLHVTQAVSPLTRRLPGTTPPRHVASSAADYARTHPDGGVEVVEVATALNLDRPLPAGLPVDHPQFAAHRHTHVGPNVVATITNGRVLAPYAAVMTEDDTLLFDLSPYYGAVTPSQHPVFLRCRPPAVTDVPGSVAVLTTRGSDNYYHFLTDVLPRLELLRRAGVEPDAYVVNRSTRFQRDLLDHLGLTADRCLGDEKYPHVRAGSLVVPSLPDDDLRTPPWIVPWLRARFLPHDVRPPHRRLYVSRGQAKHTRRVENEAELISALEPLGFEAIDPGALAPAEQVRAFAEAEYIVGPHGAGLTNLAFASPGAAVVELFAQDYVNECFWALACAVDGLRYRYLVGDGTPVRSRRNRGVASDITVDTKQVLQLLDELVREGAVSR
jgi:capsular polysaccharide biosynthesis protein